MKEITGIPIERPTYRELEARNARLKGALDESRERQEAIGHFAMVCVFLLAATATLLALTWGGVIAI